MTLRNAEEYGVNRKLKRNRDDHVRGKIITISCAQSLDERLYQSNVRYYTQIERIWKLERHTGKNCRNPFKSSRLKAPTNSSINSPPIPMPGSSRSRRYVRYSMPVLAYIVRCNPPASARTCLACASLELKEGVDGIAQHNGENLVIMNWPKPGSGACDGGVPLEASAITSGPPHELLIFERTEKAIFAVVKSSISLEKCSIVEMTVSKMG